MSAASSLKIAFLHCSPGLTPTPPLNLPPFLFSESVSSLKIYRLSWLYPSHNPQSYLSFSLCVINSPWFSSLSSLCQSSTYFLYLGTSNLLMNPFSFYLLLGVLALKNNLWLFWGGKEEINIYTQSSMLNPKSVPRFFKQLNLGF